MRKNRDEEKCDRSKVRSILPGSKKEGGGGKKRRKSFGGEFRVLAAHRASKIPWPRRV